MAEKFKYSDDQLKNLINGIFDGSIDEHNLPEDLYGAISEYMLSGVYKGFGGSLVDFEGKDLELLNELRENTYMFSAAKVYQQTFSQQELLFNSDGERRSMREFSQLGAQNFEKWNDAWGLTEYNTAISQAQNASHWNEIQRNKDLLPYLMFQTTGGDKVCEICAPLDGLTAPVDDPIWDNAMPDLHFNDECIVIQLGEEEATPSTDDEMDNANNHIEENVPDIFKMNPGKDGYIFSPEHPYFDVAPKDREFAKENFGLPIPSAVQEVKEPLTGLTLKMAKEIMPTLDIPKNELSALTNYTGKDYSQINAYFRGLKPTITESNETISKDLDKFLLQAPKVSVESYRGITLDEYKFENFKNLQKGDPFTDKEFMSTSYEKSTATAFGNNAQYQVEMIIKGKSGVLIEDFSDAKKEKEILFGRGTNFKVESIKTTEKKGITGKIKMVLIEL